MPRFRPLATILLTALVLLSAAAGVWAAAPSTLAILNLRPTNFEAMGYNGEILYALISALEKEKSVELVPRRQMEDKLFQAGLVQGDTPEMALEAAKVLGIRFVLFGNVTKEGARIRANLNLMDTQHRRVAESWTQDYGSREDILAQIPAFAAELAVAIARSEASAKTVAVPVESGPAVTLESIRAVSEGDKVKVRWQVVAGAPIVAYHVYRADSADGPFQFLGRTDASEFVDAGIRKGRNYYYRIGVLLGSGQEIKQDYTAEIRNAGEKIPQPPLILSANGHVRRIEIKYVPNLLNDQENFTISEYRIFRRSDLKDDWAPLATAKAKIGSQTELGFTFQDENGLEDGRKYTYALASVDKKGRESPLSDPVSVVTVPRPQLRLEKEALLRRIEFSWQPLENVEGYYLYRKLAPEDWKRVGKIRQSPAFPFTDDAGLEDGQQYDYRLTAYDAMGETGPSNIVAARTKDLPPAPADIVAQSGMVKSVQLTWTPVDDPDVGGYAIFSGTDSTRLSPLSKVRGYQQSGYRDAGSAFSSLEDGTDYFYQIASYNLHGAEGPRTPVVRARTKPRPAAPGGIGLSALPDRILVEWRPNPEPDIRRYLLYRSRSGGGWSKVGENGPGQTSFADTDLKPDSEYRYRIIVEDADGLKSDPAESDPIASPIVKPAS
jgi:fibronectin type 3 domain-containing protein/TolB-like protein